MRPIQFSGTSLKTGTPVKIAVVGLGYVGLPLSLQFARSGVAVLGLDIDPAKVEALNAARKPMNGSHVLVLDLAYKPNVDDDRESPSYVLMDLLKARGAEVAYYDPYVPVIRMTREHPHWAGTHSAAWNRETLERFDAGLRDVAPDAVRLAVRLGRVSRSQPIPGSAV